MARAKKTSKKVPRRRRTADEARRLILDAAERQLAEVGPAGLRLQEVAKEVGVSHPTVLHHFGSREELVAAVVQRGLLTFNEELLESIRRYDPAKDEPAALIDRVFEVMGDRGHARLLTWLSFSGHESHWEKKELRTVAEACHVLRSGLFVKDMPPFEDTVFTVLLAALAAFGEGVCGDAMRRSAGLGSDQAAARRFRRWLAQLLLTHLATPVTGPSG